MGPAEVAAECARRLADIDGVAAVVLGGSRALGVADHWSDVDLGIFYDPARPFALSALRALAKEFASASGGRGSTAAAGSPCAAFAWTGSTGISRTWPRCSTSARRAGPVCAYQAGYPHGFHSHIYLADGKESR